MSIEKRLVLALVILSMLIIPIQCAITLPAEGYILVKVASVDAAGDAKLSLDSPIARVLFDSCKNSIGETSNIKPNFMANTNLIFSVRTTWNQGMTIKSTDSNRCRVTHPANNKWILGFEDGDDGDFNDFVIEVTLKTPPSCTLNPLNHIIMPIQADAMTRLDSVSADNDAKISLTKPNQALIWSSTQHTEGPDTTKALGNFKKCAEVEFSLFTVGGVPGAPAGKTFLSTDPNHCRITRPDYSSWQLSWEDGIDNDFNDFVMTFYFY
jgi:hypothetical protein